METPPIEKTNELSGADYPVIEAPFHGTDVGSGALELAGRRDGEEIRGDSKPGKPTR